MAWCDNGDLSYNLILLFDYKLCFGETYDNHIMDNGKTVIILYDCFKVWLFNWGLKKASIWIHSTSVTQRWDVVYLYARLVRGREDPLNRNIVMLAVCPNTLILEVLKKLLVIMHTSNTIYIFEIMTKTLYTINYYIKAFNISVSFSEGTSRCEGSARSSG